MSLKGPLSAPAVVNYWAAALLVALTKVICSLLWMEGDPATGSLPEGSLPKPWCCGISAVGIEWVSIWLLTSLF